MASSFELIETSRVLGLSLVTIGLGNTTSPPHSNEIRMTRARKRPRGLRETVDLIFRFPYARRTLRFLTDETARQTSGRGIRSWFHSEDRRLDESWPIGRRPEPGGDRSIAATQRRRAAGDRPRSLHRRHRAAGRPPPRRRALDARAGPHRRHRPRRGTWAAGGRRLSCRRSAGARRALARRARRSDESVRAPGYAAP